MKWETISLDINLWLESRKGPPTNQPILASPHISPSIISEYSVYLYNLAAILESEKTTLDPLYDRLASLVLSALFEDFTYAAQINADINTIGEPDVAMTQAITSLISWILNLLQTTIQILTNFEGKRPEDNFRSTLATRITDFINILDGSLFPPPVYTHAVLMLQILVNTVNPLQLRAPTLEHIIRHTLQRIPRIYTYVVQNLSGTPTPRNEVFSFLLGSMETFNRALSHHIDTDLVPHLHKNWSETFTGSQSEFQQTLMTLEKLAPLAESINLLRTSLALALNHDNLARDTVRPIQNIIIDEKVSVETYQIIVSGSPECGETAICNSQLS